MDSATRLTCPFEGCDFADDDSYIILLHVETLHPESGVSPFAVTDQGLGEQRAAESEEWNGYQSPDLAHEDENGGYVDCPHSECGEPVLLDELQSHMDLHMAVKLTFRDDEDTRPSQSSMGSSANLKESSEHSPMAFSMGLPKALRNIDDGQEISPKLRKRRHRPPSDAGGKGKPLSPSSSSSRPGPLTSGTGTVRRLGKAELGPYANEEKMPASLRSQLEEGAQVSVVNKIGPDGSLIKIESVANEVKGILPVLAQLCLKDDTVNQAYLCHPGVQHVTKMAREGSFCGYRNIQMMISFMQAANTTGSCPFGTRIPTILNLQDGIEAAWDMGINSIGRIETGGIRGTRKYIGTPEVQALFGSLNIGCEARFFSNSGPQRAYDQLLVAVERYFVSFKTQPDTKVNKTLLPPIYFQTPGHSLTIVGIEQRKNDTSNLLVFDPVFKTATTTARLIGTKVKRINPERLLRPYRRGSTQLGRHKELEMLMSHVNGMATYVNASDSDQQFLEYIDQYNSSSRRARLS
ncbi:MAG: hypothetical protein M1819_007239 [Sarea resinae]|nr:MAG: hypothetical protein M1819_007239 [Sarea resinae]